MSAQAEPQSDARSEVADDAEASLRILEQHGAGFFRLVFPMLPIIALLMAVVGLYGGDPMYSSALVAVALAVLLCKLAIEKFPVTLKALLQQNVLAAHGHAGLAPNPRATSKRFAEFVATTARHLNHYGRWVLASLLVLIAVSWRIVFALEHGSFLLVRPYTDVVDTANVLASQVVGLIAFGLECLLGFAVGLLIWYLLAIGYDLWRISRAFALRPQIFNPDGCGGLRPLGNMCLLNALIVSVPGIYLAIWMNIGPTHFAHRYGNLYVGLQTWFLVIPVVLALVTFLGPLLRVHQIMSQHKQVANLQTNLLAREIQERVAPFVNSIGEQVAPGLKDAFKEVQSLRELSNAYRQYRTWPFDSKIVVRLLLAQSIQLLELAGLSKPLQEMIKTLAKALTGG